MEMLRSAHAQASGVYLFSRGSANRNAPLAEPKPTEMSTAPLSGHTTSGDYVGGGKAAKGKGGK